MLQTIVDETHRLVRLVDNLLDMARLDSGSLALNRQWHVLEEIVGSALARLRRELVNHRVQVRHSRRFAAVARRWFLAGAGVREFVGKRGALHAGRNRNRNFGQVRRATAPKFASPTTARACRREANRKCSRSFSAARLLRPDGRRGVGLGLAICQGNDPIARRPHYRRQPHDGRRGIRHLASLRSANGADWR